MAASSPQPEAVTPTDSDPAPSSEDLFARLYDELKAIAARRMAGQRKSHTLQPTALIHEAYLRVVGGSSEPRERTRAEFLCLAARAMRSVLVDHERGRATLKRMPIGLRLDLEHIAASYNENALDLLDLDAALESLQREDPTLAQLVELRFFAGQTVEECAEILELSERQAYRRWRAARAFLRDTMNEAADG